MQEFVVSTDEQGQRLDKLLLRRMKLAPSSFIHKMLRKKNITLEGRKADGSERVQAGNVIRLFLSDETIRKFSVPEENRAPGPGGRDEEEQAYQKITPLLGKNPVLYEDANILIIRKVPGVLSQKAAPSDLSMNEWVRGWLRHSASKSVDAQPAPGHFRPSVCNRLDRNTGGILLCAKSLQGSRTLSFLIRDHRIRKTYQMIVHGRMSGGGSIEGDLYKDHARNHVCVISDRDGEQGTAPRHVGTRYARTVYRTLRTGTFTTLAEADLITGRSHQLRVHMASIGHPILFDPRYGDREKDRIVSGKSDPGQAPAGQLLWCTRITFPQDVEDGDMREVLAPAAGRSFVCPLPEAWNKYLQ